MNSYNHSQSINNQVSNSFLEQLYHIIDTRLQYVEYLTQTFVKACLPDFSDFFSPLTNNTFSPKYQDCFLDRMENYSKIKRQLLYLRSAINLDNAWWVYHLLFDDRYQKFEEKELKIIIAPSTQQ